jgi:hypothetical protein
MLKLADLYRMLEIYNVDLWMRDAFWVMQLRERHCPEREFSREEYDLEDLLLSAIRWRKEWNNDHAQL